MKRDGIEQGRCLRFEVENKYSSKQRRPHVGSGKGKAKEEMEMDAILCCLITAGPQVQTTQTRDVLWESFIAGFSETRLRFL